MAAYQDLLGGRVDLFFDLSSTARVIAAPDLHQIFIKAGGKPLNLNPAQTHALVKRDVERWSQMVREIGVQLE